MSSPETFITLITGFLTILAAIGAAVYWITRKVTRLEDRIEGLEKNPLLEAFREVTKDHASRLTKLDEILKNWEDHKVSKPESEGK
jgi:hypothetical protein